MREDESFRGNRRSRSWVGSLAAAVSILPILAGLVRADLLPADQIIPDGHSRDVLAIAFTPDGKTLVTAGDGGQAKLWDVANSSVRANLAGHEGDVSCVAVSPDGKTLATGGADGIIRLWAAESGTSLGQLSGHSGPVAGLVFAPDGASLASGSLDGTIRLWEVASRRLSKTLKGHNAGVRGVAFAPDGTTLASASSDHSVKLWDVAVGQERATLGLHQEKVLCVAFSPDGKTLVSGGRDQTVRFWQVDQPDPKPAQDPQGARQPPVVPLGGDVLAIAFSPDGKTLAVSESVLQPARPVPGSIVMIDLPSRQVKTRLRAHLGAVRALAFSRDGHLLASAGGDRSIRLWDVNAGPALRATWLGPWPPGPVRDRIMIHVDPVEAVAITPDGKTVATATGGPIVTLWNTSTHEARRLRDPSGPCRAVAVSPDGHMLATGGDGKVVTLWDLGSGQVRATLAGHEGPITCVAFARDGKTLASGSRDSSVTLWDVATRQGAGHSGPAYKRSHVCGIHTRWQDDRHRLDRLDREALGSEFGRGPSFA